MDYSDLMDDGDTITMEDGRELRLCIEPDDMSIMDEQGEGMWCGRLEWGTWDSDYGRSRRPGDFDGGAEIIYRDGHDHLWWDVPADLRRGRGDKDACRQAILDLLGRCRDTRSLPLLRVWEETSRDGPWRILRTSASI